MKQKQESKITTLCRLVAVYNDMLCAKNQYENKISVTFADKIGVRLSVGKNANTLYTDSVAGAISFMAVRLCNLSNLPSVSVNVLF